MKHLVRTLLRHGAPTIDRIWLSGDCTELTLVRILAVFEWSTYKTRPFGDSSDSRVIR